MPALFSSHEFHEACHESAGLIEAIDRFVIARVSGGSSYDALIAVTAKRHSASLLTRDERAAQIYERLGTDAYQDGQQSVRSTVRRRLHLRSGDGFRAGGGLLMLRHVVMFRWAEDVDADHVAEVRAGLDGLPGQIPEIAVYRHGPDVGINDGNYDYVVVGDFASADDYVTYRDHPVHRSLIDRLITGRVTDRAAVQYEIGG